MVKWTCHWLWDIPHSHILIYRFPPSWLGAALKTWIALLVCHFHYHHPSYLSGHRNSHDDTWYRLSFFFRVHWRGWGSVTNIMVLQIQMLLSLLTLLTGKAPVSISLTHSAMQITLNTNLWGSAFWNLASPSQSSSWNSACDSLYNCLRESVMYCSL